MKLKMPRLHSRVAIDRPEITKLPPIPEVVWQQPQETHLKDIHKNTTNNIKRKNDVVSQTSPIRETSSQVSGSDTESLLGNHEFLEKNVQRNQTEKKYNPSVDQTTPRITRIKNSTIEYGTCKQ